MVVHAYDPSTWRQEISRSSDPQLHNKCEASLSYMRLYLKGKKKKRGKTQKSLVGKIGRLN